MNRDRCGRTIPEGNNACPFCASGGEQAGDGLAGLVALARDGDQNALAALYEKTYNGVFYTIKSMIRDEDTVLDLLQDTYVKAFTHSGPFSGRHQVFTLGAADRGQHGPGLFEKEEAHALYRPGRRRGAG